MLPPETVRPFDEARPPEEIPPAKVEVALEVALIEATTGVEVETTLPFASVEMSIFAPVLESLRVEPEAISRVVPELKVRVPEE